MASQEQLITTTRRFINEPDEDNSHFTDAELLDYINQGIRFLGTQMEWAEQLSETTTVTNQPTYALPDDFISLIEVFFDGTKLDLMEREDLSFKNPSWPEASAGKPVCAYKSDNAELGLFPKPDANSAGLTLQIQYIKVPPELSSDAAVPDLHRAFHDCLPFYAAFCSQHKMGNEKLADRNLQLYDYHRKSLMSKVQRFSDDNFRFRWSVWTGR